MKKSLLLYKKRNHCHVQSMHILLNLNIQGHRLVFIIDIMCLTSNDVEIATTFHFTAFILRITQEKANTLSFCSPSALTCFTVINDMHSNNSSFRVLFPEKVDDNKE